MTDYTPIQEVLDEAQDAINSFDNQVKLVNSMPYPIELYELIVNMRDIIQEKVELDKQEKAQTRLNRIAIDELSDRLSDAMSENIELTVRMRAKEEDEAVATNQAAADAFLDQVITSIFRPSTTEGTKQ
jgi:septum formation inhibitor MinC